MGRIQGWGQSRRQFYRDADMSDARLNFFVGQLGASAALLGLLFVDVSTNLSKILGSPDLANRALLAMLLLSIIFIISSIQLAPGQPLICLGAETLILRQRLSPTL